MEELANTLVEGYKKAKAAIEDLAENLVDNEDLYDKACAALKRGDYETLDEVISMVTDEGTILHLLHKCCQLADVRAVSIMCQPPTACHDDDDDSRIEWSPTEISRRRDILCSLNNRQEVVETAIDSLIRYRPPADSSTDRGRGDPEACLEILIGAGFSVSHEDDTSLLQLCIRHQNLRLLRFLLRWGCRANVTGAGPGGGATTPLMHVLEADAVARNKAEAMLMELEGGGECQYQSSSVMCSSQCVSRGSNLFQSAMCYRGNREHDRNSRNWGSPVEVARFSIGSPVENSVPSSSSVFGEMFRVLVRAGADVNAVTPHGSVLHCAVETLGFGECASPYYLQLPAYIMAASTRLDPNAVDEEGRTALHLALTSRRFEAARQILNIPGVDVNSEDALGFTPLHLLSWNNNPSAPDQSISLLHRLFSLGANMNQNPSPFHPITIAMENCLFEHVTFLIRHAGMDLELDDAKMNMSENGDVVCTRGWDYFSVSSNPAAAGGHGVVIPSVRHSNSNTSGSWGVGGRDDDEVNDHVRYILRSGLTHLNALTLAAMLRLSPLTALMLRCLVHPRRHLLIDAVRAWCVAGDPQETPVRVWYLANLQEFADGLPVVVSLFDLCRIRVRRAIGCVCLHRKIDGLRTVPDKVKSWLKLESL